MKCSNCGQLLPSDSVFCSNCGTNCAAQKAASQPEDVNTSAQNISTNGFKTDFSQESISSSAPVISEPAENLDSKKPKKKGPKKIIITVVCIVLGLCIALGAVVLIFGNSIKNFIISNQSPATQLQYVYSQYGTRLVENAARSYDKLVNLPDSDGSAINMEIEIAPSATTLLMVKDLIDINDGDSLKFCLSYIKNGKDIAGINISAGIGDETLVSAQAYYDSKTNCITIAAKEINSSVYVLELTDSAAKLVELFLDSSQLLLTGEDLKNLYMDILTAAFLEIKDVSRNNCSISANGVSANVTCLSAQVNKETVKNMVTAVIDKLISSETVKKILENAFNAGFDSNNDFDNFDEFYKSYCQDISDIKKGISTDIEDFKPFYFNTYVNSNNEITGVDISGIEGVSYKYYTAVNGDRVGIEMESSETQSGETFGSKTLGSGNIQNGLFSGSLNYYSIIEGDLLELVTVKYSDVSVNDHKNGYLCGKMNLTLSEDLATEFDLPVALSGLEIEATVNNSANSFSAEYDLKETGFSLFTVKSYSSQDDSATVIIPQGETTTDFNEWLNKMDFSDLERVLFSYLKEEAFGATVY